MENFVLRDFRVFFSHFLPCPNVSSGFIALNSLLISHGAKFKTNKQTKPTTQTAKNIPVLNTAVVANIFLLSSFQ